MTSFRHAREPSHPIPEEIEAIGKAVLDAAFAVHSELGPGLLERAYAKALSVEIEGMGLGVETEVVVPLVYKGRPLGPSFRLDAIVEGCIVVEVKSLDEIHPVHVSQVLTYLRLSDLHLGYVLNFNVPHLKDGVRRVYLPGRAQPSS